VRYPVTITITKTFSSPTLVPRDVAFDYNNELVMGVNLGGWLALEPWITPSIFDAAGNSAVDEYTLCQTLGHNKATSVINNHYATFITYDDFAAIQAAGMNHVRVGIGYWAINPLPGDPYVQGALAYLDKAVSWARQLGLKLMIDLHGAPGGQNGFDNSGQRDVKNWGTGNTIAETLETIKALTERYAPSSDVVTIIELINEPEASDDICKSYYDSGYGDVRAITSNITVAICDKFYGPQYWNDFNPGSDLILDMHVYQIFNTSQVAQSPSEFFSNACGYGPEIKASAHWTIVGEWSGALTDCAKYLNNKGVGARYDGTYPGSTYVGDCGAKTSGTVDQLSSADKYNIRRYNEAQLDAYSQRTGWMFWTWKTEGAPEWDMQAQLNGGLFPHPLSDRQFPGQCGYPSPGPVPDTKTAIVSTKSVLSGLKNLFPGLSTTIWNEIIGAGS
jgi:glucan 1,3-beta-glucosidase